MESEGIFIFNKEFVLNGIQRELLFLINCLVLMESVGIIIFNKNFGLLYGIGRNYLI